MEPVAREGTMPDRPDSRRAPDPLTEPRQRSDYTPAERAFSVTLQRRLQELLEGRCNGFELLRRYPSEPGRLGVIAVPRDVPRNVLRLEVAEALTWAVIDFVRSDGSGGPVAQSVDRLGRLVESRLFPTRYPHVVIERVDRYAAGDGAEASQPLDTTWSLRRVQNQRAQTQINRVLDALSVGINLVGFLR